MPITRFPDPDKDAGPEGLLALGGDLHPDSLILAYRQGIFPWPIEGYPLAWFCPPERGILELDRVHVPRSLAKTLRKQAFRLTVNQAFDDVIRLCATVPRRARGSINLAQQAGTPTGTWITPELIEAYGLFHRLGYAQSIEVWKEDLLVGGLYGVAVEGVFAGESMFHLESGASKAAILFLVEKLRARGSAWIDIQMVTPHMEALGARAIPRTQFLARLKREQSRNLDLGPAFSQT